MIIGLGCLNSFQLLPPGLLIFSTIEQSHSEDFHKKQLFLHNFSESFFGTGKKALGLDLTHATNVEVSFVISAFVVGCGLSLFLTSLYQCLFKESSSGYSHSPCS